MTIVLDVLWRYKDTEISTMSCTLSAKSTIIKSIKFNTEQSYFRTMHCRSNLFLNSSRMCSPDSQHARASVYRRSKLCEDRCYRTHRKYFVAHFVCDREYVEIISRSYELVQIQASSIPIYVSSNLLEKFYVVRCLGTQDLPFPIFSVFPCRFNNVMYCLMHTVSVDDIIIEEL